MKPEDIFVESVVIEEKVIKEASETEPGITTQISFIRDNFMETQLGDKTVMNIVEDDDAFPTIEDKFREILRRMDPPSRIFWRDHRDKILKAGS